MSAVQCSIEYIITQQTETYGQFSEERSLDTNQGNQTEKRCANSGSKK